jgi:hypothetical protein
LIKKDNELPRQARDKRKRTTEQASTSRCFSHAPLLCDGFCHPFPDLPRMAEQMLAPIKRILCFQQMRKGTYFATRPRSVSIYDR